MTHFHMTVTLRHRHASRRVLKLQFTLRDTAAKVKYVPTLRKQATNIARGVMVCMHTLKQAIAQVVSDCLLWLLLHAAACLSPCHTSSGLFSHKLRNGGISAAELQKTHTC